MRTSVTRRYHFEAAHWLPHVPETHKCHRIHGHNYEVEVTLAGEVGSNGFIMDFFELDTHVLPLIEEVDHRCLNDILGLENPTAELIAAWFLKSLWKVSLVVARVRVFETKDCWADVTL